MEIDHGNTSDTKMEDINANRYMRLHAIVEDIKSGSLSRTADWYYEHYDLLSIYKVMFKEFSTIHPEITNTEFREKATKLDQYIAKLLREYESHKWFGLYDYMWFNEYLIWIIYYVFENMAEEDEMNDIFKGMKI
jgi:hypothetical protein